MSLEDFGREVMGKPPKNRDMVDRWIVSDEDGCSYDRQVWTARLPLGVGIAVIAGLLVVAWASDDPVWHDLTGKLGAVIDLARAATG